MDLAQSQVINAYGVFMVAWSVLEGVIQAAICKELDVSATKAVIVTGKLQFYPRAALLQALLKLHDPQNSEAISLLDKVEGWARRNALVHGLVITGEPGQLSFVKYEGGASAVHSFTPEALVKHTLELNMRTKKLKELMGISDADVQAIGDATLEFVKTSKKK